MAARLAVQIMEERVRDRWLSTPLPSYLSRGERGELVPVHQFGPPQPLPDVPLLMYGDRRRPWGVLHPLRTRYIIERTEQITDCVRALLAYLDDIAAHVGSIAINPVTFEVQYYVETGAQRVQLIMNVEYIRLGDNGPAEEPS